MRWDSATGIMHVQGLCAEQETVNSTTPGCPPAQTASGTGAYDLWMTYDEDPDFNTRVFVTIQDVWRSTSGNP